MTTLRCAALLCCAFLRRITHKARIRCPTLLADWRSKVWSLPPRAGLHLVVAVAASSLPSKRWRRRLLCLLHPLRRVVARSPLAPLQFNEVMTVVVLKDINLSATAAGRSRRWRGCVERKSAAAEPGGGDGSSRFSHQQPPARRTAGEMPGTTGRIEDDRLGA